MSPLGQSERGASEISPGRRNNDQDPVNSLHRRLALSLVEVSNSSSGLAQDFSSIFKLVRTASDPDLSTHEEYRFTRRGNCDLDEAADIARDEGLRRPRVVSVTERRVVVRGRTPDGPEIIVFADGRGCPVIG